MFQVALLGGIALTIVSTTGSLDVPVSVYATIGTSFLWFVLGFAFFASLSAALASLVSRQEEVSGVMSPVTSLLLVSYLGSLYAANAPNSSLSRLLSLIPPISAIAMPARMASGQASGAEVVLAAVLMIGADGCDPRDRRANLSSGHPAFGQSAHPASGLARRGSGRHDLIDLDTRFRLAAAPQTRVASMSIRLAARSLR